MAVTIDASVGALTSNSFVTLSELKTYILTRLHNSTAVVAVGAGTSDDTGNRALVTATRLLCEDIEWEGGVTDADGQALQWPRAGMVDEFGLGISSSIIPTRLKNATCELAILYIDTDLQAEISQDGMQGITVGPIDLRFNTSNPKRRKPIPDQVFEMISLWGSRKYGGSFVKLSRA